MNTIGFDYGVGDPVRILALELDGRVIAMTYSLLGATYRVVWWSEGARRDEWLHTWEIAGA